MATLNKQSQSVVVGFYRHSKSPHSSSLLFSQLISSYVNIFVTLNSFCEEIVIVIVLNMKHGSLNAVALIKTLFTERCTM